MSTASLDERGRALQPEKPRIVRRTEGVDVLGFHVQRRGQKLLLMPQTHKGQTLRPEVRSWLQAHQAVAADVVIRHLTPLIRGWAMDDRHVVSQQTVQQVDDHSWRALWHWANRRHPKKPTRGTSRRYVDIGRYGATF